MLRNKSVHVYMYIYIVNLLIMLECGDRLFLYILQAGHIYSFSNFNKIKMMYAYEYTFSVKDLKNLPTMLV